MAHKLPKKFCGKFAAKNLRFYGFTLIELMVAITALAILAGSLLLLVNPLAQVQKSRDVSRKNDLSNVMKALDEYYVFHEEYPTDDGSGNINIPGASWGGTWPGYMKKVQIGVLLEIARSFPLNQHKLPCCLLHRLCKHQETGLYHLWVENSVSIFLQT